MTTNTNKYYCSQKFWWLTVDLGKSEILSCCAAAPNRIDFEHIKKHPGELFNSPELLSDRQLMLANQPVGGCNTTCWQVEAQGKTSRRIIMDSDCRTHTNIVSTPKTLHIIVGSNCNMTCAYCCKYYSSSWARDVKDNGTYPVDTTDDRFTFGPRDQVIMKLGQKDLINSSFNSVVLRELKSIAESNVLDDIIITGGEPFLYLGLEDLVSHLAYHGNKIRIVSGLGVDVVRFEKEIDKLKKFSNVCLTVSAESTGKLYELVRYGNTWERFLKNIATIESSGIQYNFSSIMTNLTVTGLFDFLDYVGNREVIWATCTNPQYLATNVLDDTTKANIISQISNMPEALATILSKDLAVDCVDSDRLQFSNYIKEFAKRRSLNLDVLPKDLVSWIDQ